MVKVLVDEISEFFLSPNVVNFAVASVFGRTFYPVISDLVKGLIIPIFSALFFKLETEGLSFSLRGVDIFYGDLIGDFIIFILSMLTVLFIFIKPFSNIIEKQKEKQKETKKEESTEKMQIIMESIKNIESRLVRY